MGGSPSALGELVGAAGPDAAAGRDRGVQERVRHQNAVGALRPLVERAVVRSGGTRETRRARAQGGYCAEGVKRAESRHAKIVAEQPDTAGALFLAVVAAGRWVDGAELALDPSVAYSEQLASLTAGGIALRELEHRGARELA